MKTILPVLVVASFMLLGTLSCKEKKKSDDIIVGKYVPELLKEPIRLPVDMRRVDVNWLNNFYTVTTKRQAADSLSNVKDDSGQEYVDNSVSVFVQRSDSSVFFSRTFVKESFTSFIDDSFKRNGYLENIIFQGVEDGCLKFGASVTRAGYDDEFIPLDIFVDRMGGVRISEGRLFDKNEESH